VVALLGTTFAVIGAKSPAAARWNHRASTQTGVRAQAHSEAAIPPALIWQEIRVIEQFGDKLAVVDNQPGGDSVGDYVVFRDRLLDPNTRKQVGTIDVQCLSGFADMCRGVAKLNNRGQITFDGMTPLGADPDRYAIVGGIGKFADVGGVMRVDFPGEDHALLTFTLTH
jgi:hypothetical protein